MIMKANKFGSIIGIAFTAFLLLTSAFALTDRVSSNSDSGSCVIVTRSGEDSANAISGKVVDGAGRKVSAAKIILEDEHGRKIEALSDKSGCFRIDGIVAGAVYHVEVIHRSGTWAVSARSFLPGDEILLSAESR